MSHYQRIACLSTESVETLYALGAEEFIAGISGFTVRPPRARQEKPKISGFSSSRLERILAVEPDLAIGFSNLQAEVCRDLAQAGIEVHLFNQRSVDGILRMVAKLASMVEREQAGRNLVADLQGQIDAARTRAAQWTRRPTVYQLREKPRSAVFVDSSGTCIFNSLSNISTAGHAGTKACRENVSPEGAWRRLKTVKLPTWDSMAKTKHMRPWAVSMKQEPTEANVNRSHIGRRRNLLGSARGGCQFEEWNEPLMSGIGGAAELIKIAGGADAFPELSLQHGAKERIIIADPMEVVRRAPDIIIASWCGKKFQPDSLRTRTGWDTVPALKNNMLFEIKSPDILSPGPSAITHGLRQISDIVARWQELAA